MKEKRYGLILVLSAVVVILLAMAAESLYFSDFEYNFRTRRFNKILVEKEKILEDCVNNMKPILARGEPHGSSFETSLFSIAAKNDITILYYIDKKLADWSDNGFEVPLIQDDSLFARPLIFLQNGWFLTKTVEAGNEKIVGLLRIRTDYGFENDIVKNGFVKEFRIPGDVGFSTRMDASQYHVFNRQGSFLFSLIFPEIKENTPLILIPLILYTIAFILLFLLSLELVKFFVNKGLNRLATFSCLLIFVLIYALVLITGKPLVMFRTELFSQYLFTLNSLIPSLGHLVLLSILAAGFSYVYYCYYPLPELSERKNRNIYLIMTILLLSGAMLVSLFHNIFAKLILNSNISFETYKLLKLSVYSVAGFASMTLLLLVPVFYLLKVFRKYGRISPLILTSSIITSLVVFAVIYFDDRGTLISLMAFYLVMVGSIWLMLIREVGIFNQTVIFSLIFGIYALCFIINLSEERTTENLKIQALSLSTENDPVAENLLLDIWPEIKSDTILKGLMNVDYFEKSDVVRISDYLLETYFFGYWGNFKFSIIPCGSNEPLRIGPGNEIVDNCFGFFDERINRFGHQLTGTQFYFLDNQGGRTYYLGRLFFKSSDKITNGLFIELYSDVNVFQPGYSELLLDRNYHGYARLKDYSFAKYINGEVVLKSGDFPYDKNDDDYIDKKADYRIFNAEGYKHILYKNGNITVIISRPLLTSGDLIISFAYLFAFIFLFTNLILLIIKRPVLKGPGNLNFRQKLQMSFIGILLFSFILIGIGVAYLTISQYRTKHYENIKEKLNSVYIELDSRLSMEKQLTSAWSNSNNTSLDELLIKLSNIFNTDINLYGLDGILIATSRPEIYSRDLTSRRMNNMALTNLTSLRKSEYLQKEKIGHLEYISAYIPFYNTEDKVLAYLNLPYFRMQSILTKEITNLIVAVINFTLLLIVITMALAVFISGCSHHRWRCWGKVLHLWNWVRRPSIFHTGETTKLESS